MHEQPHQRGPERAAFAAPRLDLPRFQFSQGSSLARPAAAPPPQPQPTQHQHQPHAPVQHAPVQHAPPRHAPLQHAPAQYAPVHHAPAHHAPVHAPFANPTAMRQPVAVSYAAAAPHSQQRPAMRMPAQPMASTTRPAAVSWDRLSPQSEPTLLQRITPVHMGVLTAMVLIAMVVTSGPASMTVATTRLPALVSGGGTSGDPLLAPRSGATAVNAATAQGAAHAGHGKAATPVATPAATRAAVARRARLARANRAWIIVGSARVSRRIRSGGIPSPAAAANLAIAGGGRVAAGSTGAVQLNGIPSAAAAEQLGPETLPYRPDDGVTLPRMVGERDGHAVDSHYRPNVLPYEEAAAPAMTPGAAAEQAERRVVVNNLSNGSATPPPVNGGLVIAY